MFKGKNNIMTRYSLIVLCAVLLGIAIIIKAAFIMFAERQYWNNVADRFVKENVTVPAMRGNIISSDGQLVASSLPEYKIYMDFQAGGSEKDSLLILYMDSICNGLHKIFPDKSKNYFKQIFAQGKKKKSRHFAIYPNRISYIQYKEAKQLPLFEKGSNKSGFHAEVFNQRKKPFGSLAMRTLGDMYADMAQGPKNGLELSYDSILRGEPGLSHRQKVMNKYLDIVDKQPINGCDIVTTIDVSMQDIAEKALIDELKLINGTVGVAILMEVKTGNIKAIVNMTKCDDGVYRELKNNAVSDLMEPGSTFKTASLMVALEDGKVTPDEIVDTGNGIYNMHGSWMKDHNWHRGGYGKITATEALMYSSNVGISKLIDKNYFDHPEQFVQGLYKLGIGMPLNLEIPGWGKPRIRMPKTDKSNWSKTALAWMSIGYETQLPPINTLTFYNAIANNGTMVKPKFVESIVKDGEVIEEMPTVILKDAISSPKTIGQIQDMLHKEVVAGTGKTAGSKHFSVSGKTGTAQISQGKAGYHSVRRYMVSFCGYFPSENPKYTCIVTIQKPGLPASGGLMSGKVFHEISERVYAKHIAQNIEEAKDSTSVLVPEVMNGDVTEADYVLNNIEVKNDGSKLTRNGHIVWAKAQTDSSSVSFQPETTPQKLVPSVIGMGAKDAVYLLEKRGLRVHLSGVGKVKQQSLIAGARLTPGQTILLTLKQ
ncbi:MAG: penicillin-binding transpeptidase domain-containing protein [Phocaeicola sp.]|uniref:penicillin-binding protein n=1 Tax=Phocaeicola sp. TaxID=2773926 RepID=UPI003F9EFF96